MRSLLKIVAIATITLSSPPIGAFADGHSSRQQVAQDNGNDNDNDDDDDNDVIRTPPTQSNQGEDHYVDQFCNQPWCPWQSR